MCATHLERTLAVADWDADPVAVTDELAAANARRPSVFGLLVPARLHGLAWIGDPKASCPCAERQLAELERLARERGLRIATATVGDPERVGAVTASLDLWDAERVVLLGRRASRVARRVARKTGRRVARVAIPSQVRPRRGGALSALAAFRRPHCEAVS